LTMVVVNTGVTGQRRSSAVHRPTGDRSTASNHRSLVCRRPPPCRWPEHRRGPPLVVAVDFVDHH
ncbi:hypothetical protein A2U01_0096709, partial [Trifolium medium]|nr:hypothetical protein [Trifolium medium]